MSLLVAADQVDKIFPLADGGEYIALKGIDLTIKTGEFVSFIGHSGCGKSTLLNMIAGLTLPSSGVITLEGKQIREPGPDRMVVFQNYSLLPWRTVRENIALAVNSVYGDQPKGDRRGIVEEHINLVGLQHAADTMPGPLSGGMKQRVAIARALAIRPKVLLLDEPFAGVDPIAVSDLQQLIHQLKGRGMGLLITDHNVRETLAITDRAYILSEGSILAAGSSQQVGSDPLVRRHYLGESFQL